MLIGVVPTLVFCTDGDDGLFADLDGLYEGRIIVADNSALDEDNCCSQSVYADEITVTVEQHDVTPEDSFTAEKCFPAGGSRAPMLFESKRFNASILEWIESRV